jgi:hypothetical protein
MTPLERVDALYRELVSHYHEAQDAETRAAVKLLLVAIAQLRQHGGGRWADLVHEYVTIAERDPERFERILRGNRANASSPPTPDDSFLC